MCMYGSKCYQKSRKHREMYCHDENEDIAEHAGKKKSDEVSHGVLNGLTYYSIFSSNFNYKLS